MFRKKRYAAHGLLLSASSGFLATGIFSFFLNMGILISPLYTQQVFDRVLQSHHTETLLYLTLITVFMLAIVAMIDGARGVIVSRMARWWDDSARDDMLAAIVQMSRLHSASHAHAVSDLMTVRQFVGSPSIFPFFDAPWMPLFILAVALIHPALGIIAAAAGVILFANAFVTEARTRRLLRQLSQHQARAQHTVDVASRHADSVHSMGMLPGVIRQYRQDNDHVARVMEQVAAFSAKSSAFSKFVRYLAQIGVLGTGAYFVTHGDVTSGGMIAGSIILGRALAPAEQAMGAWKSFVSARGAYSRLNRLFAEAPYEEAKTVLPRPEGRVELMAATLVVPGQERPILRSLSLGVEPGTVVGIVGPSGSGKSTLCRLLVGALDPTSGSVRLDGTALKNWNREQLAQDLGYLPQSVDLLDASVKQNIARMQDVADEEIVKAALIAGCHDMIASLPDGYDTQIGQRGAALSGGQRQMIGLARAFLRIPRLIVLDEPNSNLDEAGEKALSAAIKNMKMLGSTIFIVSHRSSAMSVVDTIVTLNQGTIERVQPREDIVREALKPMEAAIEQIRRMAANQPRKGEGSKS